MAVFITGMPPYYGKSEYTNNLALYLDHCIDINETTLHSNIRVLDCKDARYDCSDILAHLEAKNCERILFKNEVHKKAILDAVQRISEENLEPLGQLLGTQPTTFQELEQEEEIEERFYLLIKDWVVRTQNEHVTQSRGVLRIGESTSIYFDEVLEGDFDAIIVTAQGRVTTVSHLVQANQYIDFSGYLFHPTVLRGVVQSPVICFQKGVELVSVPFQDSDNPCHGIESQTQNERRTITFEFALLSNNC